MGVLLRKVRGSRKGLRLSIQKVDILICVFCVLTGFLLSYGLDRAQSNELNNKGSKASMEVLFKGNKDLLKDSEKKAKIMEFLKKG